MGLRRYFVVARRWWWLLLLGIVPSAAIVFLITRAQPSQYLVTTRLFVSQAAAPGSITYSDALLNQQLAKTYSVLITSPVVLSEARQRLNVGSSAFSVTATPVQDTQLIDVAVASKKAELSRDAANTIANVFIEQQAPYLPAGQAGNALRIAQPALLASPTRPSATINAAIAAATGLILAVGLVALLEYLDDTVKSLEDLERTGGLALIGTVMRLDSRVGMASRMLTDATPTSAAAEAYRLVRTNLEFAAIDGRRLSTLQITSPLPREGKSTTAANLAIVLAQNGKKVLLVDADFRRPSLHTLFGTGNRAGLTNLLVRDGGTVDQFAINTQVHGLRLLTSGALPPNPAELLSSPRFAALLKEMPKDADFVIVDSPPVLLVSDSIILASLVDGTLIVVEAGHTRAQTLVRAIEALQKVDARVLGALLNKVSTRNGDYVGNYYGYSSAHSPQSNAPSR